MSRFNIAVAALAVVLVAGCDLFKPDNYYPLGAGSVWSYETCATFLTPGDGLDTTMTGTVEVRVTGTRQLASGNAAAEFVATTTTYMRLPFPDTIVTVDTQYVRDAGDWILGYDALDDAEPDTVLALPLAAGKSWHANDSTALLVEAQEDLTVPAGTYRKTWRVAADRGGAAGLAIKQWYANGIGLAKILLRGEPQPGYVIESHTSLVSAEVKD